MTDINNKNHVPLPSCDMRIHISGNTCGKSTLLPRLIEFLESFNEPAIPGFAVIAAFDDVTEYSSHLTYSNAEPHENKAKVVITVGER